MRKIINLILLCILIFLVFSILFPPHIANSTDYTFSSVSKLVNQEEFFVFNLRFDSINKLKNLPNNEFLFNDKLTACYLTILKTNPSNFTVEPLTIRIHSPSNRVITKDFRNWGRNYYLAEFPFSFENDSSVTLNETGYWWISVNFNKTGSIITWFFSDPNTQNFTDNSTIQLFQGYSINVLSNSDYQFLQTVKSLNDSAISSKESSYWLMVSTGALIVTALVGAINIVLEIRRKIGIRQGAARVPEEVQPRNNIGRRDIGGRLDNIHNNILSALRDNQPLIVLTSLAIVMAGLTQYIRYDVSLTAIGSAVGFFIALVTSLYRITFRSRNLYIIMIFFAGLFIGFGFFLGIIMILIIKVWSVLLAMNLILFIAVTGALIIIDYTSYQHYIGLRNHNAGDLRLPRLRISLSLLVVGFIVYFLSHLLLTLLLTLNLAYNYFSYSTIIGAVLVLAGGLYYMHILRH